MGFSLSGFDQSGFEKQLRSRIEASLFEEAEALIRRAAMTEDEPAIMAALDKPLSEMAIEDWPSIGADMEDARRWLPPGERDREWQAVFVGLVNHTGYDDLFVQVAFGLDATPGKMVADFRPRYMTEEQFEQWSLELATRTWLPEGRRYRASYGKPGLRLSGLDELLALERVSVTAKETQAEQHKRWVQMSLAAAGILLRFHQLVERFAANPGLPRPMAIFAHVASVEWPMEQGIYEFGTDANRLLQAASDRYDLANRDRLLADRSRDRSVEFVNETRQIICEHRENELALELWPWWHRVGRRAGFAAMIRHNRRILRDALQSVHGVDASAATGERLYRLFAEARHPRDPESALSPIGPERRSDLHRIMIAYAKKFGGRRIRERFAAHPDPSLKGFGLG